MIIMNPGSENKGGTPEEAIKIAKIWEENIKDSGIVDVVLIKKYKKVLNNFLFTFKHLVTDVEINLETHGFSKEELKEFVFKPRIYWNGCSTSNPKIEDFLKDGYEAEIRIIKIKNEKQE